MKNDPRPYDSVDVLSFACGVLFGLIIAIVVFTQWMGCTRWELRF